MNLNILQYFGLPDRPIGFQDASEYVRALLYNIILVLNGSTINNMVMSNQIRLLMLPFDFSF